MLFFTLRLNIIIVFYHYSFFKFILLHLRSYLCDHVHYLEVPSWWLLKVCFSIPGWKEIYWKLKSWKECIKILSHCLMPFTVAAERLTTTLILFLVSHPHFYSVLFQNDLCFFGILFWGFSLFVYVWNSLYVHAWICCASLQSGLKRILSHCEY